ncbi:hypothetical protein [Halobacteriovorax sp. JY17]|uniref:hypothetical protein n=1 Tax=Halobacteriovorax sp. JY17 TaxID=2014617 RepID=UPI000C5DF7BF|nr:hypothetical protein [Halobacteriovorax sp. JY17]PIK15660.1 MAG: hypothetical protein CES88_02735 [Halobacteriovorax sp. JY17]
MKKILMALVTLLTVSSVSAEVCTAKLDQLDRFGSYTIQTFVKFDFNQQRACNEALRDCRQELNERRRWDRNANLTCSVEGRGNGNGNRNCSYDMQRRNGAVIDTFSRQSCRAAEDACMRDLIQRNRNGRNLRARCVQSYSRPTPPTRNVTRSCTVDRRGGQGRVRDSHTAQASGRQGSGVLAKACQKAMNQCQRNVINRQYCTQR